jgi:hypothetical protein
MDKQNPSVKDWSFFIGSPDEKFQSYVMEKYQKLIYEKTLLEYLIGETPNSCNREYYEEFLQEVENEMKLLAYGDFWS